MHFHFRAVRLHCLKRASCEVRSGEVERIGSANATSILCIDTTTIPWASPTPALKDAKCPRFLEQHFHNASIRHLLATQYRSHPNSKPTPRSHIHKLANPTIKHHNHTLHHRHCNRPHRPTHAHLRLAQHPNTSPSHTHPIPPPSRHRRPAHP